MPVLLFVARPLLPHGPGQGPLTRQQYRKPFFVGSIAIVISTLQQNKLTGGERNIIEFDNLDLSNIFTSITKLNMRNKQKKKSVCDFIRKIKYK